jgi:hypothetical protein
MIEALFSVEPHLRTTKKDVIFVTLAGGSTLFPYLIPASIRGFFREISHFIRPSKLIKNQNTSIKNAEKLNLKRSENIISNEPAAFSAEKLNDELGSLSSCRSR